MVEYWRALFFTTSPTSRLFLKTSKTSWWVILMDERSPSHMNLGPFQTIWVHGEISLSLPVLVGAGDPEFGKQHGNKTSPLSGWRGFAWKNLYDGTNLNMFCQLGEVQPRNYQTCGRCWSFCSFILLLYNVFRKKNTNLTKLCWQMYISKSSRLQKISRYPVILPKIGVGDWGWNLVLRQTDPYLN